MHDSALASRVVENGSVTSTQDSWRFVLSAGNGRHYRLAQIDDYADRSRADFEWQPPLTLQLRARVSSNSVPGTWGFGLWNDPFGLACTPASGVARMPALPQAAWFFSASTRSYLSLRDDKPANGFFAQVLNSPGLASVLVSAAVALPFTARRARRAFGRLIDEDAAFVESDPCTWHRYQIRWNRFSTEFLIDDNVLLASSVAPRPPLGIVIWIDNQYAAFDPQGRIAWGFHENPSEVWMEVHDLICRSGAAG